ncbi:MAG: hypothetical protein BGN88_12860 [Clostridiales bacterium 43-6]|nr:MAG: hypothetical protein BGN88_12860 [Clostridiales bacterium 43-6]
MKGKNDISDKKNQRVKANVIILSDRLVARAKELSDYIRSCTDSINVIGIATNSQEVMFLAINQSVDFLIIAGYLKNERSYGVIKELFEQQKNCVPVHWAILDSLILTLCQKYNISLMFDRTLPKSDFIDYLKEHKDYEYEHDKEAPNTPTFLENKKAGKAWLEYLRKFKKSV